MKTDKPKFKAGDRVRWLRPYNPRAGAEAVVVRPQYTNDQGTFVGIIWDRKHTSHVRDDGGYYEEDFALVAHAAKPTKAKKESQAYKGNGKHSWEPVTGEGHDTYLIAYRLRVPGGYLYHADGNVVFVPMPEVVKHKV